MGLTPRERHETGDLSDLISNIFSYLPQNRKPGFGSQALKVGARH